MVAPGSVWRNAAEFSGIQRNPVETSGTQGNPVEFSCTQRRQRLVYYTIVMDRSLSRMVNGSVHIMEISRLASSFT